MTQPNDALSNAEGSTPRCKDCGEILDKYSEPVVDGYCKHCDPTRTTVVCPVGKEVATFKGTGPFLCMTHGCEFAAAAPAVAEGPAPAQMPMYLCVIDVRAETSSHDFNNKLVRFTFDRMEALKWKQEKQEFEDAAARDGFRGPSRFVVRTGGGLPDEGPTASIVVPGTGAWVARVFRVMVEEL